MLDIVSAIYDMMGRFAEPCIDEHAAREHVERVFMVRWDFRILNVALHFPPYFDF